MKLYKYTSHHGLKIIRDLQLKVTPPDQQNDTFEISPRAAGEYTAKLILSGLGVGYLPDLYFQGQAEGDELPPYPIWEGIMKSQLPRLAQVCQERHKSIAQRYKKWASDKIGIISFTEHSNMEKMWNEYADLHRGMVIEFDSDHPFFHTEWSLRKVGYQDERIPFYPDFDAKLDEEVKVFFTKGLSHAGEAEWRVIRPLVACARSLVGGKHLYFANIPPDLITGVILGSKMPQKLMHEIVATRAARALTFQLWQARDSDARFGVTYSQYI